jgi:hypothetical protein
LTFNYKNFIIKEKERKVIGRYILAEKEINSKIRVEVSTNVKYTDGSTKASIVKLFINDKEVLSFGLDSWEENDNRHLVCELLETFEIKDAYDIAYNQKSMNVKRIIEY